MDKRKIISGWGNFPKQKNAHVFSFEEVTPDNKVIRGGGRSYGDAAIGKNILSTLTLSNKMTIDEADVLTCDSGFLLRNILNYLLPLGYTIPTIPGTQFVTLGGMVAADVHGKNHVSAGTIGNWIKEISIKTSNGETNCSLHENKELFEATIGGMGLTGIILKVKLQLVRIGSCLFEQKTSVAHNLENLIDLMDECQDSYQVAWIDLLNKEERYLHFSAKESSEKIPENFQLKKPRLTIPKIHFSILSPLLMRQYNQMYYHKMSRSKEDLVDVNDFFFPLDKYNKWNNLYGGKGMIQYQFVLPKKNGVQGLNQVVEQIRSSSFKPYLSVLKKHGAISSPGVLSFPIEGYSLALDFPYREGLVEFLNQLDKIVIKHGGRIYLAKDACLQASDFDKMYPTLNRFKKYISNSDYSSNLANRLKIK